MANLISRGEDIKFTILPYSLNTPIQQELIAHPSDYVLGYITNNKDHWSLAILKEFPYIEQDGPWIVYSCSPQKAKSAFGKILNNESLQIYNWDTWSVKGKDAKIAVITDLEIY